MRELKELFITSILLFLTLGLFAQKEYSNKDGYKLILKAEKSLFNGNLTKAAKYIKKAKCANYGFCGNSWAAAYGRIYLVEAQILNKQGNYERALLVLDSITGCSFGADCSIRDSIKIVTLILKYGEEKVKEAFKKIDRVTKTGEYSFVQEYCCKLIELHYDFCFEKAWWSKEEEYIALDKNEYDFKLIAKKRSFYKLIE